MLGVRSNKLLTINDHIMPLLEPYLKNLGHNSKVTVTKTKYSDLDLKFLRPTLKAKCKYKFLKHRYIDYRICIDPHF